MAGRQGALSLVRLEVTNVDAKPRSPTAAFELLDEELKNYEMLAGSRRAALERKLNPDVSQAVSITFEVPEGDQHTYYLRVTCDKGLWHRKQAALIRLDPKGPEPAVGEWRGTALH